MTYKNIIFFSVYILGVFLLGCSGGVERTLLLDSFEGELNEETVDFGSSEGSTVTVSAEQDEKMCGEQSLKISYDLKSSGYMWVARGFDLDVKTADKWVVRPEDVPWRKYNGISLFMLGRNSRGVIAFDIKDAGGEMWRFLLDDRFSGWKEIVCPFKHFFARKDWQPDNAQVNGVLDFPIKSFQFEPRLPGKAEYCFDCVKLVNKAKSGR